MLRDCRVYIKSLCARIDDQGRVITDLKHSSVFFLQRVGYICKDIVDSDSIKKKRSFSSRRKLA